MKVGITKKKKKGGREECMNSKSDELWKTFQSPAPNLFHTKDFFLLRFPSLLHQSNTTDQGLSAVLGNLKKSSVLFFPPQSAR